MSGGVDSTAAAVLLARRGAAGIGATMKLWDCAAPAGAERGAAEAQRAAGKLGLDHVLLEMSEDFRRLVLEPFCREYAAGRTPSPCLVCNREVKFGLFAEKMRAAGYPLMATGHYARVKEEGGRVQLLRGASAARDQSYFLAWLTGEQLARARLPVGGLEKGQARALAAELGLEAAGRRSSQEFCFAPDGDYQRVLARYAPEALEPGPLLDTAGKRLGEHAGIGRYTIGQRRGLGVAAGEALYVQRILADERAVVVGPDEELWAGGLAASRVNWIPEPPAGEIRCTVRVRHAGSETPSTVRPLAGGRAEVRFEEPVRAAAPGQFAAFYRGGRVLGGGFIDEALES